MLKIKILEPISDKNISDFKKKIFRSKTKDRHIAIDNALKVINKNNKNVPDDLIEQLNKAYFDHSCLMYTKSKDFSDLALKEKQQSLMHLVSLNSKVFSLLNSKQPKPK